ncbi:MAG: hypothetical protein RLZZ224_899 [Verrucomicrobiota bacterium]
MIELSFTEFCLLLIISAMVLVGLFDWISRFAHWNSERRGRRTRFACRLCLSHWENSSREPVDVCPKCGRSCERSR